MVQCGRIHWHWVCMLSDRTRSISYVFLAIQVRLVLMRERLINFYHSKDISWIIKLGHFLCVLFYFIFIIF